MRPRGAFAIFFRMNTTIRTLLSLISTACAVLAFADSPPAPAPQGNYTIGFELQGPAQTRYQTIATLGSQTRSSTITSVPYDDGHGNRVFAEFGPKIILGTDVTADGIVVTLDYSHVGPVGSIRSAKRPEEKALSLLARALVPLTGGSVTLQEKDFTIRRRERYAAEPLSVTLSAVPAPANSRSK